MINENFSQFTPLIIMDERERGIIRDAIQALPCILKIATLDVGDYIISAEIGIERKRGDDFVASIIDNRLFDQMKRMRETYAEPILILENIEKSFEREGMRESSIYGALVYVASRMNIKILPTADESHTAHVIWRMAAYAQQKGSLPPEDPSDLNDPPDREVNKDDQLYFLEGFNDIGPKRANDLLRVFRTPMDIINGLRFSTIVTTKTGTPKSIDGPLKMVPGIGPKFLSENLVLLTASNGDKAKNSKKMPKNTN
jgi:ERCC4-type nuclease